MAMLIPEQISILRKKRDELLERLVEPTKNFDFRNIESMKETIKKIDYNESMQIMKAWKKINDIITHNDFVKSTTFDSVSIGTKFLVQLNNRNKSMVIKNLTCIDNHFTIKSMKDTVTVNSPMGCEILNKKEGDTFSYKNGSSEKIYGQILSIIKDPNMYISFLRKDGENVSELNLTNSQKLLLKEEKARLENTSHLLSPEFSTNLARVQFIETLLNNSNLIESDKDVISVGSEFKIHYYGSDTDNQYELINRAVTDELSDAFIEKDSDLGKRILGLSNNEKFSIELDNGTRDGFVYDLKVLKR